MSAGLDSVALRAPVHPLARDLLAKFGGPIAAPSANTAGEVSPTHATHVAQSLGAKADMILDGGACAVGLESTVIDLCSEQPALLRHGADHLMSSSQAAFWAPSRTLLQPAIRGMRYSISRSPGHAGPPLRAIACPVRLEARDIGGRRTRPCSGFRRRRVRNRVPRNNSRISAPPAISPRRRPTSSPCSAPARFAPPPAPSPSTPIPDTGPGPGDQRPPAPGRRGSCLTPKNDPRTGRMTMPARPIAACPIARLTSMAHEYRRQRTPADRCPTASSNQLAAIVGDGRG